MKHLPPPCKGGCGRPLRPRGADPAEYAPTQTWIEMARGLCNACYKVAPKQSTDCPPNCSRCDIPLRRKGSEPKEGTRLHDGYGWCTTCRSQERRKNNPRRPAPPTECGHCEYPLRPKDVPEFDMPGTIPHEGHGLCSSCYGKKRRGTLGAKPEPVKVEAPVVDASLGRLMAERRERLERLRRGQEAAQRMELARRRFIQQRQAA